MREHDVELLTEVKLMSTQDDIYIVYVAIPGALYDLGLNCCNLAEVIERNFKVIEHFDYHTNFEEYEKFLDENYELRFDKLREYAKRVGAVCVIEIADEHSTHLAFLDELPYALVRAAR